jgi:lipoprotein-anchoring transpeptidase ErfK/SrfK
MMNAVAERPKARADAGTLVEVDKSKQLIFFVVDGRTTWILNTSTGSEIPYDEVDKNTPGERQTGDSITRVGLHDVYRERPEGWWEGDLGEIYRPKYFSGGQAVHGSNSIPNYAASHGCVRVSVPAMDWIWEQGLMPMDIPVWVYGSIPAR